MAQRIALGLDYTWRNTQALCTYIGNKNAEPVSHIGMAAELINRIWSNGSPYDPKIQKATNHLFQALLYRNRGDEWLWGSDLDGLLPKSII